MKSFARLSLVACALFVAPASLELVAAPQEPVRVLAADGAKRVVAGKVDSRRSKVVGHVDVRRHATTKIDPRRVAAKSGVDLRAERRAAKVAAQRRANRGN